MWRLITKSAIQNAMMGSVPRSICAGLILFFSLVFSFLGLGITAIWSLAISLATLTAVAIGIIYHRNELHYSQIEAVTRLTSSLNSERPLPALRGWRLAPDAACFLVQYLKSEKIENVFEIGSGASTIIIAMVLKQKGSGKVQALEHDREQAARCQLQLEMYGLSRYAEVHYAPLVEHSISGKPWLWYDLSQISPHPQIDLLLIDGPPVWVQKHARYPALPLLKTYLSAQAVILLDDAHRWSERGTLRAWSHEYRAIQWTLEPTEDGLAVGISDTSHTRGQV